MAAVATSTSFIANSIACTSWRVLGTAALTRVQSSSAKLASWGLKYIIYDYSKTTMHIQCSDKRGEKHFVNKAGIVKIFCEMKIRQ